MDEFRDTFAGSGLRPEALLSSYAMAENVFAATQSAPCQPGGPTRIWADHKLFRSDHLVVKTAENAPDAICFISSGRLLRNAELQILSDSGETLVEGQVGEILLRSDCLFEGYCNRPDLTAEALVNGWYHTGDLGFVFDDELYVVGRKKDLLIIAGENIYPQDIEDIVTGHKAIHDGRAIAMEPITLVLEPRKLLSSRRWNATSYSHMHRSSSRKSAPPWWKEWGLLYEPSS